MAQPSPIDKNYALEGQLREMYGRAAYTHKTHQKMADAYVSRYKHIKLLEIILSASTTTSLIAALLGDSQGATVVGAILSAILAGCALYFKEASLGEQAQLHTEVGAKLWGTREALLSLLVDLNDGRSVEDVRQERDRLNNVLEDIYKAAPRTNGKSYASAQKALKDSEELFFTDEELNKMLPKQLRKKGSAMQ
ncbi:MULTISPECIES: SLATT domain-containing protein [Pseudomonas]|uniref:SLATT domain-containing protein n=1 Tax=Pseudomonas TaxID=286 RepID=UPI001B83B7C1|nr:SLATT domain-containing protein [Pseudomonas juntendi]MBR7523348.1 SLATT domain-containing protein [Pseudomonas juntendi]